MFCNIVDEFSMISDKDVARSQSPYRVVCFVTFFLSGESVDIGASQSPYRVVCFVTIYDFVKERENV